MKELQKMIEVLAENPSALEAMRGIVEVADKKSKKEVKHWGVSFRMDMLKGKFELIIGGAGCQRKDNYDIKSCYKINDNLTHNQRYDVLYLTEKWTVREEAEALKKGIIEEVTLEACGSVFFDSFELAMERLDKIKACIREVKKDIVIETRVYDAVIPAKFIKNTHFLHEGSVMGSLVSTSQWKQYGSFSEIRYWGKGLDGVTFKLIENLAKNNLLPIPKYGKKLDVDRWATQ